MKTNWLLCCLVAGFLLAPAARAKHKTPTPVPSPAPEAQALFEKAQEAFRAKRYREAKNHLLGLVTRFPMEQIVPKSRLLLAELEEDFEVSLEQFKILAQEYGHRPEGSQALKDLGNRYYLGDRYGEAAGAYQDYLKRYPASPDEPEVRYWLGASQAALGQDKKAVSQFDKAIHADPEGKWAPKSYLALGNAYLKQRRYQNALDQYLKVLDKYPRYEEMNQVYLKMGRTYEAQGKRREAYAAYRTLAVRFPKSIEAPEATDRISELESQNPEWKIRPPEETPVVGALERPLPTPVTGQQAVTPIPTPEPPPAVYRPFRVQIGVYSNKKWANDAAARLKRAGHETDILPVKLPGSGASAYKVRSGHYATREEAREAAETIKDRLKLPAIVVEE